MKMLLGTALWWSMGCGVPQEEVDALSAQLSKEQEKSADLEARLDKVESKIKGIGYRGLRVRWDNRKWVQPDVRCRGAQGTPRDFGSSPAQVCINSGYMRYKRPDDMRVQVRVPSGEVVFNERVPFDQADKAYCLVVPEQSCESIHSLGVGTSPPALNTG